MWDPDADLQHRGRRLGFPRDDGAHGLGLVREGHHFSPYEQLDQAADRAPEAAPRRRDGVQIGAEPADETHEGSLRLSSSQRDDNKTVFARVMETVPTRTTPRAPHGRPGWPDRSSAAPSRR